MADKFDPYHVWLAIPPDQRPPTHYQLLAISPEERDRAVINAAVARQSAYVRNFQVGKHGADAARILSEIQAARICLLDAAKRAAYDALLERESPRKTPASVAQPASLAIDLDALAGAAAAAARPARVRQPPPRRLTLAKGKKSSSWQKPAIGVSCAVLALLIIGFVLARLGPRTTVATQAEDVSPQQQSAVAPGTVEPKVEINQQRTNSVDRNSVDRGQNGSKLVRVQPPATDAQSPATTPATAPATEPAAPVDAREVTPRPDAPATQKVTKAGAVDLLALVDLERDVISGDWKLDGQGLSVAAGWLARIEIPVAPPDEYELAIVVEGQPKAKDIHVGLIMGGHLAVASIDMFGGQLTHLDRVDGKPDDQNPTSRHGRVLRDDRPNSIVYIVRRNGVRLECNEQTVLDWSGDPSRMKKWEAWSVHHPGRIFLSANDNACRFTKLQLTATSPSDWRPVVREHSFTSSAPKKLPKPDGEKLRAVQRTVKAIYTKQLRAAKTKAARLALADRMRDQAIETHDDIALRYGLLDEARTRAVAMGQVSSACEAIEELGRTFDLDVLSAKEEAIIAGLTKTTTSAQLVTGLMVSMVVSDRAMAVGDFQRAERLVTAAETAAQKLGLPALTSGLDKRRSTLKALQASSKEERAALSRLQSHPEEEEANCVAGMYESLVLGDWQKGLKHLAMAPVQFAEIARLEEVAEGSPMDRVLLAKAWTAAAEKEPRWKTACLEQANYWRRRAAATRAFKSERPLAAVADDPKRLGILNSPRLRPGLRAVLYDGAEFQNPHVWRIDSAIRLNAGSGPPAPGLPADRFSIRWVGWLSAPVAGRYVFSTHSDDGVRLAIDGKSVIEHWDRGPGDETAEVELNDSPHHLVVEFNDNQAAATLAMTWSLKGLSTEHSIPIESLFHDPALE